MRVVRRADGTLVPGPASVGRGAWLCRGSEACFGAAVRHRAFARALRAPIAEASLGALGRELGMPGDVRGYMDTRRPDGSA